MNLLNFLYGLSLSALGALTTAAYALHQPAATATSSRALQLGDLPLEAQLLYEGKVGAESLVHPLNHQGIPVFSQRLAKTAVEAMFSYAAVHCFSATLPSWGVQVHNFSYTYPNATAAARAATLLQNDVQTQMPLRQPATTEKGAGGLSGQSFLMQGDKGESVYWFLGAQADTLVMLLVTGRQWETVITIFEETRAVLLAK